MNSFSIYNIYKKQLAREICLKSRNLKSIFNSILFFLMIVIFFPLTIPANSNSLSLLTPSIIWVGIVFSIFLSSEDLFSQDYTDGIIEQWIVSSIPITVIVFAKLSVHYVMMVSAIIILSPILALLLKLDLYQVYILDISVICGAPAIIAFCALAEAFAVGIKQKSLIMGLVVLPLNIPILIIGSAISRGVIMHEPI